MKTQLPIEYCYAVDNFSETTVAPPPPPYKDNDMTKSRNAGSKDKTDILECATLNRQHLIAPTRESSRVYTHYNIGTFATKDIFGSYYSRPLQPRTVGW